MKTISESGIIGKDGKLHMPMDRLNAFFAANPGARVVAIFDVAERGSSELQLAYYYNYVVPAIRQSLYEQGNRMTETGVDRWLVNQYPEVYYNNDAMPKVIARQFDQSEMTDFLEWLKQYAAENLYVYIEDPQTL